MRKGRFAGLSETDGEAVKPPGAGSLLLFDFRAAASERDARVAAERARGLAVSLPFLALSHLVWSLVFAGALILDGDSPAAPAAPLALVLLLDIALWRSLRAGRAPQSGARLAAICTILSAGCFAAAAVFLALAPGESPLLARVALACGAAAAVATFFALPLLLIASMAGVVAVAALVGSEPYLAAIAAAGGLFLAFLSLSRARDVIVSAQRRLAAEWEARQARRFVEEFEGNGRGWFWETNADGAVTYVSESVAAQLGGADGQPIGRPLDELLLLNGPSQADDSRRTLAWHLRARFPFEDVVVRSPGSAETWWSLSGTPNFDECGRFLGFRGIGGNLSEERRAEAERSKLARYDSLTGLPNRALMRTTLDEALANAAERRQGCALMMIDLDRFKQVNDTLGHPIGDKLLKQVAQRLKDVLGEDGQAGRLGGDEFEAILPGIADETSLSEIAGRLIAEVSRPYGIEGHKVEIGTSVGIAIARPGKAYAAALIKDADLALYAAKAAGRGTFRFFATEMHAEATERQILASDLAGALAGDQFRLLFQPIVDTVTEEIVAFEALLRWQHPTRGILHPALIVPLAEECGLMPRIGAWVIRTACAEAARWPQHVRVAVNLSPSQFADPGLPSLVTSALAAAGVAPDRLELEITEAVFPADAAGPERMLARLKAIGVRLALDNFGTGKSGLSHLRAAPVDKIKIDRSFVRGAEGPGSRNAAIIRAIVVLGESLGIDTTAEGAETLEELHLIRRLGCSQVQGFLFGKPAPAAEASAAAAASKPTEEVVGFSRPPRHRLIRNAVLEAEGEGLPVRLRNISAGGAMVECDRPLPVDSPVRLDLDAGGRIEADVRWCERGQVGLRFAREFDLRKLARPKPGAAGIKMVTPTYLGVDRPSPAALSPLSKKPARR